MNKNDAPEMGFLALCAFVAWGFGYLLISDMEHTSIFTEQCIAAGKQVVEGNCINE